MTTTNVDDYKEFIENVRKKTDINLSLYKEAQMKRRLTSLREKKGYASFNEFFNAMIENENLYYEFLDRMTINVSEFFRNRSRWEILKDKIIPILPDKVKIKAWSAACSTGEEPYTLSMIFNHYFPIFQYDILATDIDQLALKKAETGVYADRLVKEVPEVIKNKFFKVENNLYQVTPNVKKNIRFKKHDLLVDKYEQGFDLIICRNVIIYFTDEAKQKLYQKFSEALKPGGILFVGSTEQIFNPMNYNLEVIDNFFYRKKI